MKKRYNIIATAFDKKGRVLSVGRNNYNKTHPLQKYFSLKAGESELKHCLHAELSALIQARKVVDCLVVERYDVHGNPKLAMPCKSCQEAIKAFGVRLVKYTTEGGEKQYACQG